MPQIPYWDEAVDADAGLWNFVWLGDTLLPGIATVTYKVTFELDEGKSQGLDGATVTYKGRKLTRFDVSLLLISQDEYARWTEVAPTLRISTRGQPITPYEVRHPNAQEAGITTVYIESIDGSMPSNMKKTVRMTLVEYNPPKPSKQGATPKTKASTFGQTGLPPQPAVNRGFSP